MKIIMIEQFEVVEIWKSVIKILLWNEKTYELYFIELYNPTSFSDLLDFIRFEQPSVVQQKNQRFFFLQFTIVDFSMVYIKR